MVGREKEIKLLEKVCNSDKSELVAVYGRRRIGKTYLINHMFTQHKKDCLFFRFTGSYQLQSSDQREFFLEAIYDWFEEEPSSKITSWAQAFIFLKRVIGKKKKDILGKVVVFFDELPWIDKKNNDGFIGALGNFWNDYCEEQKDIVLIVCGSNSTWIKNKIFEDMEGPLYQRLSEKIPLKPFSLKETIEYIKTQKGYMVDNKTATEIYMIFGGVAKYLSFLENLGDINKDIDKLFFTIDGDLNKEYSLIFKSLFQDRAKFYTQIIDLLSKVNKQKGLSQNELAKSLQIPSGRKIKEAIEDLQECGFILALSKYNSKINTRYIICDPFLLFYSKWVKKYSKNEILNLKLPHYSSIQNTQAYKIWCGLSFESLCLNNIDLYLNARQTKGLAKSYSYWNHIAKNDDENGVQIDIVLEYENNVFDLIECKFYSDKYEIENSDKSNILNKIKMFERYGVKGKYNIKLVILSSYGTKHNENYNSLPITADITIDDMLK